MKKLWLFISIILFLKPKPVFARTRSAPIIANHTAVQQFSQIPEYWINKARGLAVHFAHTSHGQQIIDGLLALEESNPLYSFSVFCAQPDNHNGHFCSGSYDPSPLHCQANSLCMYDGQPDPKDSYISPEEYWYHRHANCGNCLERTRSVARTDLYNVSTFAWCSQLTKEYYTRIVEEDYLPQIDSFNAEFPNVDFVYMTGRLGRNSSERQATKTNNDKIRNHVRTNNRVLYDFADIESHDPAGNYYPEASDACEWCDNWCNLHPGDCTHLPNKCLHSHSFNCLIKAKAFWWLMARLAGWNPDGASPTPTYTLIPTLEPTPTPSSLPTATPIQTQTPTPTPTVMRIPSQSPTPTSDPLCVANVAGGSQVGTDDFVQVLSFWGQTTRFVNNDISDDGKVNGIDPGWVIAGWGTECE